MASNQNSTDKTFYINFFAGIDPNVVNAIMGLCSNLQQQKRADHLYFMLASPGGDVRSGIALRI